MRRSYFPVPGADVPCCGGVGKNGEDVICQKKVVMEELNLRSMVK